MARIFFGKGKRLSKVMGGQVGKPFTQLTNMISQEGGIEFALTTTLSKRTPYFGRGQRPFGSPEVER